jgi:Big-like domain-containing protein
VRTVTTYTGLMGRLVPAFALALGLLPALAAAQVPGQYDTQYGQVIEVSVDDLLSMPEHYVDRAVRTRGDLEMLPMGTQVVYALRGTFGGYLYVIPRSEVSYEWEQGARRWVGKEIEVTGSISQSRDAQGNPATMIAIWGYLAPQEQSKKKGPVSPDVTLEQLVESPERYEGKSVNVRGQFRGENLFGDLPSSSRDRSSDWVIKEDVYSVWVTGHKAKGPGWSLDASLKRDTGKWLQVAGRVRVVKGIVTIEALDVTLTKAPEAGSAITEAKPEPTPPPPPRPKRLPVVAFSLPLDGEREVPRDQVFKVQFSLDMDEATFKDHVLFRYAGRVQAGDNALDAVKFSYDGGLRTLRIDPGDLLRPGRVVEVVFLPGILDINGNELETRPGVKAGAATDVLRFQVMAAGLAGGASR